MIKNARNSDIKFIFDNTIGWQKIFEDFTKEAINNASSLTEITFLLRKKLNDEITAWDLVWIVNVAMKQYFGYSEPTINPRSHRFFLTLFEVGKLIVKIGILLRT